MIRNVVIPVLLLALTSSCSRGESDKASFQTAFSVQTDDGTPLEGVALFTGKQRLGVTNPEGRFSVKLTGAPGATLPVETRCPEAYESPSATSLRLAKIKSLDKDSPRPIEHISTCTRKKRDMVVVVHAERGGSLPVIVDGKPVGMTDELGNAHLRLEVPRETKKVSVSLDTSPSPRLRPENPARVYSPEGRDAIALFEQSFTEAPLPRRPAKRSVTAPRHVPYRMN